MIDPKLAIPKINRLLKEVLSGAGVDPNGTFAAIKCITQELRALATRNEMSDYTFSKFNALDWHVNAYFGLYSDDGHSQEQRYMWAIQELSALADRECFGTLDYF